MEPCYSLPRSNELEDQLAEMNECVLQSLNQIVQPLSALHHLTATILA